MAREIFMLAYKADCRYFEELTRLFGWEAAKHRNDPTGYDDKCMMAYRKRNSAIALWHASREGTK